MSVELPHYHSWIVYVCLALEATLTPDEFKRILPLFLVRSQKEQLEATNALPRLCYQNYLVTLQEEHLFNP